MLHAGQLSFVHPRSGERMTFEAPLPENFQRVLAILAKERT
jgi:23S rRNA pseudouridine1911/1915/1917 synthase